MDTPLIEFSNVTKRFGESTVLDRVNLKIYEGQITTIIGLSGSGKSVLLKHIIGLLQPDDGVILFRGQPISSVKKFDPDSAFSKISYMFQGNALFDSLTVYDNIAMPLRETTRLKKAEIHRRVMARMEQTELTEATNRYPSELSGGMQKRAALARALITDPQIVLFDEPTTGQDPVRKNAILSMIAQYQRKFNFTAILVSHEIPDVYFISNRILALYDKQIVFQGPPEELEAFEHPFMDEVIQSLEGLQKELTGLYSTRQFKVLNHTRMRRARSGDYSLFFFSLANVDEVARARGFDRAEEMVSTFGGQMSRHLGAIGGFSTRFQKNEFLTLLPYSDLAEAQEVLNCFLKELGLGAIGPSGQAALILRAGIAEGRSGEDINAVIASAKNSQKEIGRYIASAGE